jgi:hypothetical protein
MAPPNPTPKEKLVIDAARQANGDGEHEEATALPAALARFNVAEATDRTEFRKKARLMASLWREAQGLPHQAPIMLAPGTGRLCAASSAVAWCSTRPNERERTS